MEPMKNGLYSLETIKESGLPIFDFTQEEETGISIDFWTKTDLKKIFEFVLSDVEQKTLIRGFLKSSSRMTGYAALYSLSEIMQLKLGWSYQISKDGPWDKIKF